MAWLDQVSLDRDALIQLIRESAKQGVSVFDVIEQWNERSQPQ
jgi:hypothetical protein